MKSLKKITIIMLILILIIVVSGLIITSQLARRGLPDYNENIHLPGLEKTVKVYRDSLGTPHIYAETEHDLYMVTGYVMAQERLWQMDLLRRVTLGRLSEIFGDKFVKTDLLLRSLQFTDKSNKILQKSLPARSEAIQAFSDGVNVYIDRNKGNYPLEFFLLGYEPDPWEPTHSLNLIGYMAWDLKAGWSELILQDIAAKLDSTYIGDLLPQIHNQKSYLYSASQKELLASNALLELIKLDNLGLDILCGSNNWAISGKKSNTGMPLLANDMHLSFGIPGIWFQIHQYISGKLNVNGLVLPGQPLVIVGHNDSVAWGMTNAYVDNLDYYEEKINPKNPDQYLFNNEWKSFEKYEETIKIKGGEEHKGLYRRNHRGPVISEFKGIPNKVLTIRWIGDMESDELNSIYLLNRANNWEEFKNAFHDFKTISQNVVYADTRGNIGMYCCAGAPVRKRDKIYAILPGWTDEYDWQGLIPFDALPYEYNPKCGYVASANNITVDSTYPYHIGTWFAQPYRIDRIREMLQAKKKLSADDFKLMQNDQVSKYAEHFLTTTLPILYEVNGWDKLERDALDILQKWNYDMDKKQSAPQLLENWSNKMIEALFKDEMGDELFVKYTNVYTLPRISMYNILTNQKSIWVDDIRTPEKESFIDIVILSFRNSIDDLLSQNGTNISKWCWGNVHQITLVHPLSKVKILDKVFRLNRGPFSVGGSYHTVSPYSYPFYRPDSTIHGASHRNIYDLNNWDNSFSVIPTGNSGVVSSNFYCDQTKLYIQGNYHPDYYSAESVIKYAKHTAIYEP